MTKKQRLQALSKKLVQYGLNPLEWRLEPRAPGKFRVYQPTNIDFEFEGTTDRRLHWIDFEMKVNFAGC